MATSSSISSRPFVLQIQPENAKSEEFFKISSTCLFRLDPGGRAYFRPVLAAAALRTLIAIGSLTPPFCSADRAFNCSIWGGMSTEERISVPRTVQMLNPVRSKQTAQPLLHLAAATSLSTTTLQRFCHRITVIDGIACQLAYQEDIPIYGKACRPAESAD